MAVEESFGANGEVYMQRCSPETAFPLNKRLCQSVQARIAEIIQSTTAGRRPPAAEQSMQHVTATDGSMRRTKACDDSPTKPEAAVRVLLCGYRVPIFIPD